MWFFYFYIFESYISLYPPIVYQSSKRDMYSQHFWKIAVYFIERSILLTEKDVFRLVTSVGQEENSESPWGIEPQTDGFHAPMLYHWATETLRWARSLRSSYNSRSAYCNVDGVSNVDGVMFVIRIREMVSFELCQEIKKDFFPCPTLVTRRKTSFSIYLPNSKLTISISPYTVNI